MYLLECLYNFEIYRLYWKYFRMDGVFYEEMYEKSMRVFSSAAADLGRQLVMGAAKTDG